MMTPARQHETTGSPAGGVGPLAGDDLVGAAMARALVLADRAASLGEVPVGAVVMLGREIVAEAHNEVERRRDATAHAELLALQRAELATGDRRLNDAVLCVTLEPCPMCAGACVVARVGRLVFGARDPKAGGVETLYRLLDDPRLNHQVEVTEGVEAEACADRLSRFFRSLRMEAEPDGSKEGSS